MGNTAWTISLRISAPCRRRARGRERAYQGVCRCAGCGGGRRTRRHRVWPSWKYGYDRTALGSIPLCFPWGSERGRTIRLRTPDIDRFHGRATSARNGLQWSWSHGGSCGGGAGATVCCYSGTCGTPHPRTVCTCSGGSCGRYDDGNCECTGSSAGTACNSCGRNACMPNGWCDIFCEPGSCALYVICRSGISEG